MDEQEVEKVNGLIEGIGGRTRAFVLIEAREDGTMQYFTTGDHVDVLGILQMVSHRISFSAFTREKNS
jgi:hypothetical protein